MVTLSFDLYSQFAVGEVVSGSEIMVSLDVISLFTNVPWI